ncbi:DUF6518 family protein [Streptomyces sp. NPDC001070]
MSPRGWLPGASNHLAYSGAVWSAVAFVVGAVLAGRVSLMVAAVAGLLTELGLVVGYYGYAEFGRDGIGALDLPLVWTGAACVAGPLFGVAGLWSRKGHSSVRRVVGAAALAGVCGGEAVHLARVLHYWIEATTCFVALLLLSLLLPRTLKDRVLALSVAVALSLLSYVIVGVAGTVVSADEPKVGHVQGLTDAELQAMLAAMLPPGLEEIGHGGQKGENAYVVVTDGGGGSRVEVTVQTGTSWTKDELFSGSTNLPGGTLLKTSKEADGAGGLVTWSADTATAHSPTEMTSQCFTVVGVGAETQTRRGSSLASDRMCNSRCSAGGPAPGHPARPRRMTGGDVRDDGDPEDE